MQQLAQNNPELVQLINQNQEDFYQLLNAVQPGGMPRRAGGPGIQVTPEENEAIERLAALGFEKALAAQVRRLWMDAGKWNVCSETFIMSSNKTQLSLRRHISPATRMRTWLPTG